MEWVVTVWALVVTIVGLNCAAAGIAAILHAWRSNLRRGARALLASVTSAFLPTSVLMVVSLIDGLGTWESGWLIAIALAMAVGTLVSFPGAVIVARKLEAPGEEYRAFE